MGRFGGIYGASSPSYRRSSYIRRCLKVRDGNTHICMYTFYLGVLHQGLCVPVYVPEDADPLIFTLTTFDKVLHLTINLSRKHSCNEQFICNVLCFLLVNIQCWSYQKKLTLTEILGSFNNKSLLPDKSLIFLQHSRTQFCEYFMIAVVI